MAKRKKKKAQNNPTPAAKFLARRQLQAQAYGAAVSEVVAGHIVGEYSRVLIERYNIKPDEAADLAIEVLRAVGKVMTDGQSELDKPTD